MIQTSITRARSYVQPPQAVRRSLLFRSLRDHEIKVRFATCLPRGSSRGASCGLGEIRARRVHGEMWPCSSRGISDKWLLRPSFPGCSSRSYTSDPILCRSGISQVPRSRDFLGKNFIACPPTAAAGMTEIAPSAKIAGNKSLIF
jgi:hypothetical protein